MEEYSSPIFSIDRIFSTFCLFFVMVIGHASTAIAMEGIQVTGDEVQSIIGSYHSDGPGITRLELSDIEIQDRGRQFVLEIRLKTYACATLHAHFRKVSGKQKITLDFSAVDRKRRRLTFDYELQVSEDSTRLSLTHNGAKKASLVKSSKECSHPLFKRLQMESRARKVDLGTRVNMNDPIAFLLLGHFPIAQTQPRSQTGTDTSSHQKSAPKPDSQEDIPHVRILGLSQSKLDDIERKVALERFEAQMDMLTEQARLDHSTSKESGIAEGPATAAGVARQYRMEMATSAGELGPEVVSVNLKPDGSFEGRRDTVLKLHTPMSTTKVHVTKLITGTFALNGKKLALFIQIEDGKNIRTQESLSMLFETRNGVARLTYGEQDRVPNILQQTTEEDRTLAKMKEQNITSIYSEPVEQVHYTIQY